VRNYYFTVFKTLKMHKCDCSNYGFASVTDIALHVRTEYSQITDWCMDEARSKNRQCFRT